MDEDGRRHHRQTTLLHVAAALLDAAAMDEVAAAVHGAVLKWAQRLGEREASFSSATVKSIID
uniref:Uncharacterized protein n=1 Tax=Oryza sativa subsp. japonica TaxID=39947 RepID=Q5Z6G0_ORYSJ|nr:hypothetical protein [Oryza sativa Japonica Group]